jgi:hypothetical protein
MVYHVDTMGRTRILRQALELKFKVNRAMG